MSVATRLAWLVVLTVLLSGCGGGVETGPGEVHWDRDTCARCAMAVSDQHYSAQVRGGREGASARLHFFDDLGCAVIWLEKQEWKDDARTEIWVTDHRSGDWIDARTAWYVTGHTTPMDYGLAAQQESAPSALDFTAAAEKIHQRDQRKERHGHIHEPQSEEDGTAP